MSLKVRRFSIHGPAKLKIKTFQNRTHKALSFGLGVIFQLFTNFSAAKTLTEKHVVFLNHEYRVLSKADLSSIEDSEFLKTEFANVEAKSVHSGSETWNGLYIWGENTYIEILPPIPEMGLNLGDSGLGLGVEVSGGVDYYAQALVNLFDPKDLKVHTRSVDVGEKKIDWFKSVTAGDFISWIMEYSPDYMKEKYPGRPELWGISRKQYNTPHYNSSKLFKDVIAVSFSMASKDLAAFSKYLEICGYKSASQGQVTEFSGPSVIFKLKTAANGNTGVREIEMRLSRATAPKTYKFQDGVTLTIGNDQTASLRFFDD